MGISPKAMVNNVELCDKKNNNNVNIRPLIPGPTRRIDPQDHAAEDKEITIQMITRTNVLNHEESRVMADEIYLRSSHSP